MSNSIINFNDLSKSATVLIERISDALGGIFKPAQIKRVAKAEATAEIIKAKSNIRITDLQRRALNRFMAEEAIKQKNIEDITRKAIPLLNASSKPQQMEDDWITNFFDKCRIISDEDMQILWAKILAGESNSPAAYSKRTINALVSFDKTDAELFTALCCFTLSLDGELIPFIYNDDLLLDQSKYLKNGITFNRMIHLSSIGLINFESMGYQLTINDQQIEISYHKTNLRLQFGKPQDNELAYGNVLLTNFGRELAQVCSYKVIDGFIDYVSNKLSKQGIVVSPPYPRQDP